MVNSSSLVSSLIEALEYPVVIYNDRLECLFVNPFYRTQYGDIPSGALANLAAAHDRRVEDVYNSLLNNESKLQVFYKTIKTVTPEGQSRLYRIKCHTRRVEHDQKVYLLESFQNGVDVSFLSEAVIADKMDPFSLGMIQGGTHFISRSGMISGIPSLDSVTGKGESDQIGNFENLSYSEVAQEAEPSLMSMKDVHSNMSDVFQILSFRSKAVKMIYHVLRPSLNYISGLAELLSNKYSNDPVGVDYLEKINETSARILDYFQYLYDLARIESGEISLNEESVELRSFFSSLFEPALESGTLSQLNIQQSVPGNVRLDKQLFSRLLTLTLSALQSTEKPVKLSVTCRKSDHQISRIFFRFYCDSGSEGCSMSSFQEKPEFILVKMIAVMMKLDLNIYPQQESSIFELEMPLES